VSVFIRMPPDAKKPILVPSDSLVCYAGKGSVLVLT
jgi:hypothetical protein